MAKFTSLYECREVILDDNGDYVEEYEENLPHGDFIVNWFCNAWNKDADKFILDILNRDIGDCIETCYMRKYKDDTKTILAIDFVMKKGKRLTQKVKNEIIDWIDGQYSDGWGEGMFGYANVMTAPDGTKFIVE